MLGCWIQILYWSAVPAELGQRGWCRVVNRVPPGGQSPAFGLHQSKAKRLGQNLRRQQLWWWLDILMLSLDHLDHIDPLTHQWPQLVPLPTNQLVSHNLLVLLGFVVAWRLGSIHCPAGGDRNHWWTLGDEADVCGTFGTVRAGLTGPKRRSPAAPQLPQIPQLQWGGQLANLRKFGETFFPVQRELVGDQQTGGSTKDESEDALSAGRTSERRL